MALLTFDDAFADPRTAGEVQPFQNPTYAIDGNVSTFASSDSGASWGNHFRGLVLHLASESTVYSLTTNINYCGGYADPPIIQTSPDGATWTTQAFTSAPSGGYRVHTLTTPPSGVNYIALADQGFGLHFFCWFQVFDVFGDGTPTPTPPPPDPLPAAKLEIDGVEFTGIRELTFRAALNDAGSFHAVINRGDPQATAANIRRGAIAQITVPQIHDGVLWEGILETGDFDLLKTGEEGEEDLSFGGPGTLAIFKRCVLDFTQYVGSKVEVFPSKGYWQWASTSGGDRTEGDIIKRIVEECEAAARPGTIMPNITRTFSNTDDTDSVEWADEPFVGNWRSPIGENCYDEIIKLANGGFVMVDMAPGFVMNAYRDFGRDLTGDDFAEGAIRFEKGVNLVEDLSRSMLGAQWATRAVVHYQGDDTAVDGWTRAAIGGTLPFEQEMFVESSATSQYTARRQAQGLMRLRYDAQEALLASVLSPHTGEARSWVPDPDGRVRYLPGPEWSDNGMYWVGDTITLHTGDGDFEYDDAPQRIWAVTIALDPETGELAIPIVELNAPYRRPGKDGDLSPTGGAPAGKGTTGSGGGTAPGSIGSHFHTQYQAMSDVSWKEACRAATTANITIATGLNDGDVVDGVTLNDGDRVLVKDQTAADDNGIYVVADSPTRAEDLDFAADIPGAIVHVYAGTINGGTTWRTTNLTPPVINTDDIDWEEFAAGGSLTVDDGTTSVSPVDTIVLDGAELTDDGGGQVTITVEGGSGGVGFVGARAYNSATQAVSAATETTVTFDSEEFDTDGLHDTGSNTGRMTVPAGLGGKYLVRGHVFMGNTNPGAGYAYLRKNGSTTIYGSEFDGHNDNNEAMTLIPAAIIDLAAGDYVEVRAYRASGTTFGYASLTGVTNTFEMFRLEGGALGTPPGARAYHSTTQNVSTSAATPLNLDTEEYDSDGFHSTSVNTSRMTVPAGLGGRYLLTGGTYFGASTAGSYRIVGFSLNGGGAFDTTHRVSPKASATADPAITTATVVDLVAGDYIELIAYQDSGGTLAVGNASQSIRTSLTITRLGGAGGATSLDGLTDVDTTTTPPTDGQALVWDDASDLWVPGDVAAEGGPTGPHELDYVQWTSNVSVTATAEASATTVVTGSAVTYDGSTAVVIEFFSQNMIGGGGSISAWLFDGSTSIGRIGVSTDNLSHPWFASRRLTPSAGAHTYSVRCTVTSGSGTAGAGPGGAGNSDPGFIRITRATGGVTLGSSPGASVRASANQAVTDGNLLFDTEQFDTDGFHSTSVNTDRLTVPAGMDGTYALSGAAYISSANTFDLRFFVNGSQQRVWAQATKDVASGGGLSISGFVDLVAGDYITLNCYTAGASRTFLGLAGGFASSLSMVRLGGTPTSADEVDFDNADSGLAATTVQEALDEVVEGGHALGFVGVRAQKGATQAISATTWTGVTFATTETFDTDGFHDLVTNPSRFTVPAGLGGKYFVAWDILWDANNSTGSLYTTLYKNGVQDSYNYRVPADNASGYDVGTSRSMVIDLAAGDYVEVYTYVDIARNVDGALFSMFKIDSPALGGPPGASAYRSTIESKATATFTGAALDTEDYDTDGFHDNVTNNSRMTVPAGLSGKYYVEARAHFASSATGVRYLQIYKNGTLIRDQTAEPVSAGDETRMVNSAVLDLVAGDYISMAPAHSVGSNLNITAATQRLTITRLGGAAQPRDIPTVRQIADNEVAGASMNLTITAAASGSRFVLGVWATTADITAVSCTNVTWTKVRDNSFGGATFGDIWVGVATGTTGTTVTVTATGAAFLGGCVAQVDDLLTPTVVTSAAPSNTDALAIGSLRAVVSYTAANAGQFWAAFCAQNNGTTPYGIDANVPHATVRAERFPLILGYVPANGVGQLAAWPTGGSSGGSDALTDLVVLT